MIKFGIVFNTQNPPRGDGMDRLIEEICAEAQIAEEQGFDGCFIPEQHQQPDGFIPSTLVLAAAVAARTKKIKVGTDILVLPLHHPVHVAEDVATLDAISGGRVILGLGKGVIPSDFAAFGVSLRLSVSLFEEGIEILRRCWTEERFSFVGKRFHLENLSITPKPLQKPCPPIWIGALSPQAVKRAARLGDGWIALPSIQTLPVVQSLVQVYRAEAERWHRRSYIAAHFEAGVGETRERAREEYEPRLLSNYRYYWRIDAFHLLSSERIDPWLTKVKSEEDFRLDYVRDRLILGSPEECVEQIERWHQETGIEYFILRFRHPEGPSHERVVQALRLFGEKVIPHFS
jgi:alkanesulfonate monooxygenase SsuD/methylene tetrahydromethanopterin reductase-like flavin-dependent oxidoreductase (luciferase family)